MCPEAWGKDACAFPEEPSSLIFVGQQKANAQAGEPNKAVIVS